MNTLPNPRTKAIEAARVKRPGWPYLFGTLDDTCPEPRIAYRELIALAVKETNATSN